MHEDLLFWVPDSCAGFGGPGRAGFRDSTPGGDAGRKKLHEEAGPGLGSRVWDLGCYRDGIKTEGRVSLFKKPGTLEGGVAVFEFLFLSVLGDDESRRRKQVGERAAEHGKRGFVCFGRVVRWVEEDQVEGRIGAQAAQNGLYAAGVDGDAGGDSKVGEILAQNRQRGRTSLDKVDLRCAAAVRLKPNCARAGEEIEKAETLWRMLEARCEHIEEGLAQAVAGGPRGQARRSLKLSRSESSANDAHRSSAYLARRAESE